MARAAVAGVAASVAAILQQLADPGPAGRSAILESGKCDTGDVSYVRLRSGGSGGSAGAGLAPLTACPVHAYCSLFALCLPFIPAVVLPACLRLVAGILLPASAGEIISFLRQELVNESYLVAMPRDD